MSEKKPRKIKPYGAKYNSRILDMVYADYRPCPSCGSPVLNGYCCAFCGRDPSINRGVQPADRSTREA